MRITKKLLLLISVLLHGCLILGVAYFLDQDRFRPTSTRGIDVEWLPEQQLVQQLHTFKTPGTPLAEHSSKHAPAEINYKITNKHRSAKVRESTAYNSTNLTAPRQALPLKSLPPLALKQSNILPKPRARNLKPAESVPIAIAAYSKEAGTSQLFDSSSNGTGQESAPFDLRLIEYGQQAAAAIRANIVQPKPYQNQYIKFRAFVTLDKNMQFQKVQIIKSTGNSEFDANIVQALRQTIYPPLPSGADWRAYHEIDFTIN
jgi:TonB family protein